MLPKLFLMRRLDILIPLHLLLLLPWLEAGWLLLLWLETGLLLLWLEARLLRLEAGLLLLWLEAFLLEALLLSWFLLLV